MTIYCKNGGTTLTSHPEGSALGQDVQIAEQLKAREEIKVDDEEKEVEEDEVEQLKAGQSECPNRLKFSCAMDKLP